jgi:toxin HigB-1
MIISLKGKLGQQAASGKYGKGFPTDLIKRTSAMLSALDAAVVLKDLRFPPGNSLEALQGVRKGQYSLRLNKQWRICFNWTPEGPTDVEIVDYH